MAYEGVKYKTNVVKNQFPIDPRIDDLRIWCKIFHEKILAPFYPGGTHGNMSFRIEPGKPDIVITAARSSFAEHLTDDSFFKIHDVNFNDMEVFASGAENREPSSEVLLHFAIYHHRPDITAILHGHCQFLSENADRLGIAVTKEYVESGNIKIVNSVLDALDQHNFLEIRNHGFLSMGTSIKEAGELAMSMLAKM